MKGIYVFVPGMHFGITLAVLLLRLEKEFFKMAQRLF